MRSLKPVHHGPKGFINPQVPPRQEFRMLIRWLLNRNHGPWTRQIISPGPAPRTRVDDLRVTWVGHSSALIQVSQVNILTDPVWSERVSPFSWVGPKRFRAPGIRFEDLPPIDLIVLSHDHYDHLDTSTLKRLVAHQSRVVCPLGVARIVRKLGFEHVHELDWWDQVKLDSGITAHCTPAQHFSGRSIFGRNRTLWSSWWLETPAGGVYFGGDSGFGAHYEEIAQRLGGPRLSLLPIGAYRPEWFMSPVHMSPAEAVQAHLALDSRYSVAIHHGSFDLADDGQAESVEQLGELSRELGLRYPFVALAEGHAFDVPALSSTRTATTLQG